MAALKRIQSYYVLLGLSVLISSCSGGDPEPLNDAGNLIEDVSVSDSSVNDEGSDEGSDSSATDEGSASDSSTDNGDESNVDNGTPPPPPETDFAFILPISNTLPDWYDLAFLASIPTASKINEGRPVVIGAEDVHALSAPTEDFLSRFAPTQTYVLNGEGVNPESQDNIHAISASNASELALYLVNNFWQSSEHLFLVSSQDYQGAVLASSLAARFDAPLLFSDGLSDDELLAIQTKLGTQETLYVSLSDTPIEASNDKVQLLVDWESLANWINAQDEEIKYIALTNTADRETGRAQKMSLVAPMFTARRKGITLPARFDIPMDVMTVESPKPMLDFWQQFYGSLTEPVDTIALVGTYDAIAQMRQPSIFDNPVAEHPVSDLPYAEIDGDPFVDLAIGRIVSETATEASVLASRTVNYEKLMNGTWENRFVETGLWGFDELRDVMLNVGFTDPTHPTKSELGAMNLLEVSAILHKDHSFCTVLGNAFDTNTPALLAPAVVLSRGCSVGGMDLADPNERTMVNHMLGKGAVAFIGASRNSIAENTLIEVSLWNHMLEGHTLGSAFRAGLNDLIVHWLDENENSGPRYSIDIEMLYGDPGLTYHVPGEALTKPAEAKLDGNTLTVHAPESWFLVQFLPEQLAEWNFMDDLFMYVGHGTSPRTYWSGSHDNEDLYFGVNLHLNQTVNNVSQISTHPSPLGWSGMYYEDLHSDGSRSLRWRVRILDYDMYTGAIINQFEQAQYQIDF